MFADCSCGAHLSGYVLYGGEEEPTLLIQLAHVTHHLLATVTSTWTDIFVRAKPLNFICERILIKFTSATVCHCHLDLDTYICERYPLNDICERVLKKLASVLYVVHNQLQPA